MTPTRVENDEALYRAILAGSDEYVSTDGKLQFTVLAFSDREFKPSVDRSSICTVPGNARKSATDGVTRLIAHQVRAISNIRVEPSSKTSTAVYAVDAIHNPILESDTEIENLAHCRIECSPAVKANHFNKRVREALANIASGHGFVVEPG